MADGREGRRMGNAEMDGLLLGFPRCRHGSSGRSEDAEGESVVREQREAWEQSIGDSRYLERHGWEAAGRREAPQVTLVEIGCGLEGEEELGCLGSKRAECDWDFQYKRAKVVFHPGAYNQGVKASGDDASTSTVDRHDIVPQGSSVSSGNEMVLNASSISNNAHGRNPGESDGEEDDDGDAPNVTKIEDLEVRMDLTDDLLHMVFSFLDQVDLCRAARVCRQWRTASSHEDFWRRLNFEDRNISTLHFAEMCHRYPNATEVNVSGAPAVDLLAAEAMLSLRNIEVLILGKGQLGDAFFRSLADCRALNHLSITEAFLGNGAQEIAVNHDRLRHLQIIRCRVPRILVRCPELKKLSLKRSTMSQAILHCPTLSDLDVANCHKFTDAGIRSAATSCPLLSSLNISNCSCVSDETLREITLSCLNLGVLDASFCPNISLESVRLPMLTDLRLQSCEGITSASMVAISHSFMLEDLVLDCCGLLTSVMLDLPRLQRISLVLCRKFVDLNLRCPMLLSVTVSNCPVLHRINITSNSLQKLVLQKQESLTTVQLQCINLQEVDLTECESLTTSICEVFSDGGGCPVLKSLVLDSCDSLTMVGFRSTSLVSLSLVGCRAMTSLELACPNLEQVRLDGCDHLERAFFGPVGLRSLNLGICPKLSSLHIVAPRMSCLELKGCGGLSQASIICPCLTSLDASFCSQLTDDCLSATTDSCPNVESLILTSCHLIGSDGLSSLRRLPNLTYLDLSYTFLTNLQPVFESCLRLKVLKLQACKYLSNSSLDSLYKGGALPALHELDLSYGSISQFAIEELLTCCTHLTHVSLNGCSNMHDLDWDATDASFNASSSVHCPSEHISMPNECKPIEHRERLLQNLNCVGCQNIKKVVIPPMARCFHLTLLNLSLSNNLREVDLACFNLSFLNLSNCCSLEILKLDCPRLTSLSLQSCNIAGDAVEAAISQCSMLETLDVRFCPKVYGAGMGRLRTVCPSLRRIFSSLSP